MAAAPGRGAHLLLLLRGGLPACGAAAAAAAVGVQQAAGTSLLCRAGSTAALQLAASWHEVRQQPHLQVHQLHASLRRLHAAAGQQRRRYTADAQQQQQNGWTDDEAAAVGAAGGGATTSSNGAAQAAAAATAWHDSIRDAAAGGRSMGGSGSGQRQRRRRARARAASLAPAAAPPTVASGSMRGAAPAAAAQQAASAAVGAAVRPQAAPQLADVGAAPLWPRQAAAAAEPLAHHLSAPTQPAVSARAGLAAAGGALVPRDIEASAEGEVVYPPGGSLVAAMVAHWRALQACPSAAQYTAATSFEEFGTQYIAQMGREEAARSRARGGLARQLAADAARGTSYRAPRGVLARLLAAWQPLLVSAIAEEQRCVMEAGGWTGVGEAGVGAAGAAAEPGAGVAAGGAQSKPSSSRSRSRSRGSGTARSRKGVASSADNISSSSSSSSDGGSSGASSGASTQALAAAASIGRRDRSNYGPYLLLLPPQDLASITLQTVLTRVATALPGDSSGGTADATAWAGDGSCGSRSASQLAAALPAVSLADALGRAVNSRLKYLAFKAGLHDAALTRRKLLAQICDATGGAQGGDGSGRGSGSSQSASSDSSGSGEALASAVLEFSSGAAGEAARYTEGQARLAALRALRGLPAALRRSAARARDDVRWSHEVRLKVGAALLALLMENSTLPQTSYYTRGKHKRWRHPGNSSLAQPAFEYRYLAPASGSSSSGGSQAGSTAAAASGDDKSARLKQQAWVAASAGLVRVLLVDRSLASALLVKVPPMLIPPLPWASYASGGPLTSRHWMMRTRHSRAMQRALKEGMDTRSYDAVLDALNVLGNTAWRINRRVYDTMCQLWADKSTAGGLPCQVPLPAPTPPPESYRLLLADGGGALVARGGKWAPREKRRHVAAREEVRRLNRNMVSLKADFLLKKQVADDYVGQREFYYPHTVDFRGRAYPLHPSLHHLGDDLCRGLLSFGRGRPLGPHGLDWLYVHLANVWGNGQDKLSYDGRRAFARQHLGTILDVALDPLANTWWQDGEAPWQTLAACCEVAAALESTHPASFVSHLPVHMDGSCNGLQHYAALGRDEAGGTAVNLVPSDTPQDVYKGVAEIVARRVAADAACGDALARRCVGLVDRKLVKQTVMTSVYGVTNVGARAQVEARLRERRADMKAKAAVLWQQLAGAGKGSEAAAALAVNASSSGGSTSQLWPAGAAAPDSSSGLTTLSSGAAPAAPPTALLLPGRDLYAWLDERDDVWRASRYLAGQTLDAIGEMFVSARAIMAWLADCAREVSRQGAPVRWVSPLGLPIMQPYQKLAMTNVHTTTQTFHVVAPDGSSDSSSSDGTGDTASSGSSSSGGGSGSEPQPWIKARQRSAFPPNFIHSIDSTHMMLTALACNAAGIEFAGVHDSFWTHPGSVHVMNRLLREKFVELHTRQPELLEDLLAQLQAQFPAATFPPIPERGQLAVGRVRASRYFFS